MSNKNEKNDFPWGWIILIGTFWGALGLTIFLSHSLMEESSIHSILQFSQDKNYLWFWVWSGLGLLTGTLVFSWLGFSFSKKKNQVFLKQVDRNIFSLFEKKEQVRPLPREERTPFPTFYKTLNELIQKQEEEEKKWRSRIENLHAELSSLPERPSPEDLEKILNSVNPPEE